MNAGPWNSLEVVKLIIAALTPLAIAFFGVYIHRVTKRFEHLQWRSQKLIEKRLAVYDEVAPMLNDILCYFTYVGSWIEIEPQKIVEMKRTIDKNLYLAAPMFSPEFFSACMVFQSLCYRTYNQWGHGAKLRTAFGRRQQANKSWQSEWNKFFCSSDEVSKPDDIRAAYGKIMDIFAIEIGVHPQAVVPPAGRVPINIH